MFQVPGMYGIFTCIYHMIQPNVGKYTIHGWYGNFVTVYTPDVEGLIILMEDEYPETPVGKVPYQ